MVRQVLLAVGGESYDDLFLSRPLFNAVKSSHLLFSKACVLTGNLDEGLEDEVGSVLWRIRLPALLGCDSR